MLDAHLSNSRHVQQMSVLFTDNKDSVFCIPYSVRACLPDLDLVKRGVLTRVGEIRLYRNDRYHY